MSGSSANVGLWSDADVYIATIGSPVPADASTAFSAAWNLVGLLDGDNGFEYDRAEDKKEHFAWGGILVATTRAKFKQTVKFTVLEDNPTTRSVIWPGSTSNSIIVPRPADVMIALETRTGGKVKRMISHNRAQVEVDGKMKDNETDMSAVDLVATIFPDASGVLFDTQGKPTVTSIAITPLTLALTVAGANIKRVVATATYSDTSTGDVTASAQWNSSAPSKATVSAGYVTGVSAGTSNVSCSIGAVTSAAPCAVTVT